MKKHKLVTLGLFLFASIASSQALACKFIPDNSPIYSKIAKSDISFIGEVVNITDSETTFKINTLLNKNDKINTTNDLYTIKNGGSSCHHRFQIGQKWLYLGETYMSGSILLKKNTSILPTNKIKLEAKSKSSWDNSWTSCFKTNECTTMYYDCDGSISVRKDKIEKVQKSIYSFKHDPRAINCESTKNINTIFRTPSCLSNQCEILEIKLYQ